MAQLDEHLGAGERHPPRLQAGTVQVDLVQQLRDEVAGLRPEHGDRVPRRGVRAFDDQLVAGVRYPRADGAQQRRQVHGDAVAAELFGQRAHEGGLAVFVAQRVCVGVGLRGHRQRVGIDARGKLLVVERSFDADLRAGVVLGAKIAPDLRSPFLSITVDQRLVQQRAGRLVAATGGEDRLDQGGRGDDVGAPPFGRRVRRRRRDL